MANSHITFRGGLHAAVFVLLALCVRPLQARENAYNVLGKALVPLVKALIASPKMQSHAATATLVLDSATNLPAADAGDTLEIAVQSPDKLLLRATMPGQSVTICRDSQKIWAWPGAQIGALIDTQKLPKADPDYQLEEFHLPVTEKQLVWLPLLFTAQDEGDDVVNGATCMVLDVTLMPDLARDLKAGEYTARLWVRPDYKLAKIELRRGPAWRAQISVKSLDYPASLPPETWKPSQNESADVLQLTPMRYKQLLDFISARWTTYRNGK